MSFPLLDVKKFFFLQDKGERQGREERGKGAEGEERSGAKLELKPT